jgi:hypothetical protein
MADRERPPFWVDHLAEKHECFSYGEARTITVDEGGTPIRIYVPDWSPDLTALSVSRTGELVTVLGRLHKQWSGKPLGIMLVAKKRADGDYEVGIWHELYPWALKFFGYDAATG